MRRRTGVSKHVLNAGSPVATLSGVGPRQAQRLERLGIATAGDLLHHLPRRYEDTREIVSRDRLVPGSVQTIRARVTHVALRRSPYKRMVLVEATLEVCGNPADRTLGSAERPLGPADHRGSGRVDDQVEAVWFNQPFLAQQLQVGMELILSGKVEASRTGVSLRNPAFERVHENGGQRHVGVLAPVYPETEGLTSRFLRGCVERIILIANEIPDPVPPRVMADESLMSLADALRTVHFPSDRAAAELARERVGFGELFLLQIAAGRARRRRLHGVGVVAPYDVDVARRFAGSLPFVLTDGQRVAAHEILTDLADPGPMNRLLQGDVGSGKTVVAAMAALMTHRAGFQTAVMAPTELLARQHLATLGSLLAPHGIEPRLLVGSSSGRARREILDGLVAGRDRVIVGTHALIEDNVVLAELGLVIVDEQHRFGVAQRQRLRQKSGAMANFLAMTATPIPRSLALSLYGDVDVSELREMPRGRLPVVTRLVPPDDRDTAYAFVDEQLRSGRQGFVVCPLIEDSDKLGVRSATKEYERLRDTVFPHRRVELLHGRMAAAEKEARMARFVVGEADLLVATSVVEVGVDVPNATVMLIEGAERFGLAQLHQFRGRVGRSDRQAYCLLFEGGGDQEGRGRLDALVRTGNGFDLAELDLRLRGPGDIVGLRQHGLPELHAADLLDIALLQRARAAANRWLDVDPSVTAHAPLTEALERYRAVFDFD